MKLVIIGGSGLIGKNLTGRLREKGHQVLAASPSSGVDTLTGAGLAEALKGADVVVDVSNSPSFEDGPVLNFFTTSTQNLLRAEAAAGVGHHVILSVVGAERLPDSGYMRAKLAQEKLLKESKIPYSILRATQFFEFVGRIVDAGSDGKTVRLTTALIQPIASDDVAAALADMAVNKPLNGMAEVGGPETMPMDQLGRIWLRATGDSRQVMPDPEARYYGEVINNRSLIAAANARIGPTRFESWLKQSQTQHSTA